MQKRIYFCGETPNNAAADSKETKNCLGGKGQSLAIMTNIGLPVPGFYTIQCNVCNEYFQAGNVWPAGLKEENSMSVHKLAEKMGKRFYNHEQLKQVIGADYQTISVEEFKKRAADPKVPTALLLSVRSGAVQSLPGMMDTVLNLGLNEFTVRLLAGKNPDNERYVLDSYRRFIMMFSDIVIGVDSKVFDNKLHEIKQKFGRVQDFELTADELREVVAAFLKLAEEKAGKPFPQDIDEQLYLAINAVFASWNNPRAFTYRNMNKIPHDGGTAVNICAMVFGNMNNISGSGVGFTRCPKTGVTFDYLYGEFLKNAQGEDVVAGTRTPINIFTMREDPSDNGIWKRIYSELAAVYKKLEEQYNDLVDLEFTVEDGKLYMLQARSGKRTAFAMAKLAIDFVKEGKWTKEHALLQIEPNKLNEFLFPRFDPAELKKAKPVTKGLSASPGAAVGQIVFNPDKATKLKAENNMKIILTREETSPEDIQGMAAAVGILTSCGGQTSHAAVVARQMGKTCVCGCSEIHIDEHKGTVKLPNGEILHELDWISIDGTTGNVYKGQVAQIDAEITPELQIILDWSDEIRTLKVRTNSDTKKDCAIALKYGCEGIGLTRSEHQFFEKSKIKAMRKMILAKDDAMRAKALIDLKNYQKSDFVDLFTAMDGRPVNIRLLDPPLHEFLPSGQPELIAELSKEMNISVQEIQEQIDSLHEQNPMIGFRGCRLGVVYPEINEMQIKAIFEAAIEVKKATGKVPGVEIMFPFIIAEKELKYFIDMTTRCKEIVFAELKDEVPYTCGSMVEIPRAAIVADKLAAICDYFSFGTNDLTQTTLGCSRDDSGRFMPVYLNKGLLKADPFVSLDQEGVGELVKMTIQKARSVKPNFKVGICGEQTDPVSIEFLHNVGLNYISCSPFRVMVARVSCAIAAIKAKMAK
ncbi:Pyruvate [Hexamita inflata]|uniref:Pyruvate, phosphate dikinase n=1 Tax=Hexamita inflata TaxID=28002 RepID=A0AA86RAN6_9EUKA|nr:Pyruvate [Hexamita inflata]